MVEIFGPRGVSRCPWWYDLYRSFYYLLSSCWESCSGHCLRQGWNMEVSFVMDCFWCSIIWGTRNQNSYVHQILWNSGICFFGVIFFFFRSFFMWLSWSRRVRSLIPYMLYGVAHWWSSGRWVGPVGSFPIYMDINEKWFQFSSHDVNVNCVINVLKFWLGRFQNIVTRMRRSICPINPRRAQMAAGITMSHCLLYCRQFWKGMDRLTRDKSVLRCSRMTCRD